VNRSKSFVNRYLIKKGVPWPEDANKFRLSPSAFSLLRSYFELSLTFLSIISNIHHPLARACPLPSRISTDTLDFWFVLPVRVQVHCSNRKNHGSYSAGKSQMNPLNYLHLANTKSEAVDIRGSQIGVYFRFDQAKLRSSTLVINFQDGRWRRVVEVPIMRMKETLEDARGGDSGKDPFYLQTVLLTSILRWWSNALNSFNDQLIAYVSSQPTNSLTLRLTSCIGGEDACRGTTFEYELLDIELRNKSSTTLYDRTSSPIRIRVSTFIRNCARHQKIQHRLA